MSDTEELASDATPVALAAVIRSITDLWDEPLDDDHDTRVTNLAEMVSSWLAEHDFRVRAIERDAARAEVAALTARAEKAERASVTLGKSVDAQCRDIARITGSEHMVDEDGDADWGAIWSRGYGMAGRLRKAAVLRSAVKREAEHFRDEAKYGNGAWREPNQRAAEQLDAVLAESMGPSGETESGEGEHRLIEPDVTDLRYRCAGCDWTASAAFSDPRALFHQFHNPAPVSSGGRVEAFVELLPPDVGHNLRHFGPETAHVTGAECHCHPEPIPHAVSSGGQADGEGSVEPTFIREADEAIAAWLSDSPQLCGHSSDPACCLAENFPTIVAWARATAARPVLPREALAARMTRHWPTSGGCACGQTRDRLPRSMYDEQTWWWHHLADVLAGEQQ